MNQKGKVFSLIALSGAMLFSFAIIGKNFSESIGINALNNTKDPNKSVTFSGQPQLISSGSTSRYSTEGVSDENMHLYLILDTVVNPGNNPIAFGPNTTKSTFYFSEFKTGKNKNNQDEPYKFRNLKSIYFDELNRGFFDDAFKYLGAGTFESNPDTSISSSVSSSSKTLSINKKLNHKFECRGQSVYDITCPQVVLSYYCDSSETPKVCTSIEVSGDYQTTFYQYSAFNHDGAIVTANFNDGSTQDVTNEAVFSSVSTTFTGTKTETITYTYDDETVSTSYQVTIIPEPKVTSIDVTVPDSAKRFFVNDQFNHDTVTVIATYDNGDEVDVSSQATFTNPDLTTAGSLKSVSVSFGGKSFNYYVTAYKKLISLRFDTSTAKTSYYVGEQLDFTNVKVYAQYNYGSDEDVTSSITFPSAVTFTEPDAAYPVQFSYSSSLNPNQTITVNGSYNVVVNAIPAYSMLINETENGTIVGEEGYYHAGDTIDLLVEAEDGYYISSVYYNDHVAIFGAEGEYSFEMPDTNVTVYAIFEAVSGDTYHLTVNEPVNGDILCDEGDFEQGTEIELVVGAHAGYEIDEVYYNDHVQILGEDGLYTFIMPDEDVTVYATFKSAAVQITDNYSYVKTGGFAYHLNIALTYNSSDPSKGTGVYTRTERTSIIYFTWTRSGNDFVFIYTNSSTSSYPASDYGAYNLFTTKVTTNARVVLDGTDLKVTTYDQYGDDTSTATPFTKQ